MSFNELLTLNMMDKSKKMLIFAINYLSPLFWGKKGCGG